MLLHNQQQFKAEDGAVIHNFCISHLIKLC